MAILNYTTKIAVEKTAAEIHSMLVKSGANAVMNEYERGVLARVSFRMKTKHGLIHYNLPCNTKGVLEALRNSKNVPKSAQNMEQAARVGWRIVKDWIEAQLAIIQADVADAAQVFLPYAITSDGRTVYEKFEAGGVGTLAITYQEN